MRWMKTCSKCGYEYTLSFLKKCINCGHDVFDKKEASDQSQSATHIAEEDANALTHKGDKIVCSKCSKEYLPVALLCNLDKTNFTSLGWPHLVILFLAMLATGVATFKLGAKLPVYTLTFALAMSLAYALFRRISYMYITITMYFLLLMPIVFYSEIAKAEVTSPIALSAALLLVGGLSYLCVIHFIQWRITSREQGFSYLEGAIALTILVAMFFILLISIQSYVVYPAFLVVGIRLGAGNDTLSTVFDRYTQITSYALNARLVFLSWIFGFSLLLSLYYAIKNRAIPGHKDVYVITTDTDGIRDKAINKLSTGHPWVNMFVQVSLYIMFIVYKYGAQFIKLLVNLTVRAFMTFIHFLINVAIELAMLWGRIVRLLFVSAIRFIVKTCVPIAVFLLILIDAKILSASVVNYMLADALWALALAFGCAGIIVGLFVLFALLMIEVPYRKMTEQVEIVLFSTVFAVLIILFCSVAVEWPLWGVSKITQMNFYSGIGVFAMVTTLFVVLAIVWIGTMLKKGHTAE